MTDSTLCLKKKFDLGFGASLQIASRLMKLKGLPVTVSNKLGQRMFPLHMSAILKRNPEGAMYHEEEIFDASVFRVRVPFDDKNQYVVASASAVLLLQRAAPDF